MNEKLKKLAIFEKDPQLAIYDQLQTLNDTLEQVLLLLKEIKDKKYPEPLPFPEIPPFPIIPEPKEPDLSKVESLLQKLIDKENKKEDIVIKLDIS